MVLRCVALVCALVLPLCADEGMWLFNNFPKDTVKAKYSFEVTDGFLENLRLASVRIGEGAGALVSPTGLMVTSRRVAGSGVGLEAEVLVALEDVTSQVKASAGAAAGLEKACAERTHDRCSVVKLYGGERYDLYRFHRYTDVRMVWAADAGIANFGGDADRFTYPRYALDVAFVRAYENGQPAATPHYLKWSADGVKENELVFSTGSPSATSRLASQAQFNFFRATQLPIVLTRLRSRIEVLRSAGDLAGAYKKAAGELIGLKDERLMLRKQQFEKRLRRAVETDAKLGAEAAKVWDDVAAAYRTWAPNEKAYEVLESPGAIGSNLFRVARELVRGTYRETGTSIEDAVETAMLAQYFEELKVLGDKEAPVKAVLQGRTPQQAAEAMVQGTKLKDAAERRRLAGDREAVAKSADPMIQLARTMEGPAQKMRKRYEEGIGKLEASALGKIAQYRFRVLGATEYPNGTGTPRVSFGAVKAYRDKTEAPAPYATTFGGLYHRAGKEELYVLPENWVKAKQALDLVTPFDFLCTADVGGVSGGPVVNTKGELVGLVFDGNIESLSGRYLYSDEQARAVGVAVQGIAEALRKVYGAGAVLGELGVR